MADQRVPHNAILDKHAQSMIAKKMLNISINFGEVCGNVVDMSDTQ